MEKTTNYSKKKKNGRGRIELEETQAPQKIKQSNHMTQQFHPKRNGSTCPEKLYLHVYNSVIIHTSQKIQTTQMSINR